QQTKGDCLEPARLAALVAFHWTRSTRTRIVRSIMLPSAEPNAAGNIVGLCACTETTTSSAEVPCHSNCTRPDAAKRPRRARARSVTICCEDVLVGSGACDSSSAAVRAADVTIVVVYRPTNT